MAEFSAQQLSEGVARAIAAGDTEAAERLQARAQAAQKAEAEARQVEAARQRIAETGSGMGQQLRAGVHRLGQGIGQTLGIGGVTPESVREADIYRAELKKANPLGGALQFVGENAPGFLVPGGALLRGGNVLANVARSAATGAVSSGALGYAGAVTDKDVHGAKAENAVKAALLGGTIAPGLGMALPGVARLVGNVFRSPARNPALAEREAQELFAGSLGDTAGAEAALVRETTRPTPRLGGPATTGEAIGSNEALQLEALVKSRGGAGATPIIERHAAVDDALAAELRSLPEPQRLAALQGTNANPGILAHVYGQPKPLQNPIVNPTQGGLNVDQALQVAIGSNAGPVRRELARMADEWAAFSQQAQASHSWEPLYNFRKEILDNTVARLKTQGDSRVANSLDAILNRDIRPAVDDTIAHASGGASQQLYGPGSLGGRLKAEEEQLTTAQREIADWLSAQSQRTRPGEGSALTGEAYSHLQKLLQERNKYGASPLSPHMQATVQQVLERAGGRRALGSQEVENLGGQAARALPKVANVLKIAGTPPWAAQNVTAYGVRAAATQPLALGAAVLGGTARQKAHAAIVKQLGDIVADPTAGLKAIRESRRRAADLERKRLRQRGIGVRAGAVLGPEATRED